MIIAKHPANQQFVGDFLDWISNLFAGDKQKSPSQDEVTDAVDSAVDEMNRKEEPQVIPATDPCSNVKTKDGYWIRREWRDMPREEQKTFLKAVNKLKADGEYDKYPLSHWKLDKQIHGVSIFYPWHRKFLTNLETELRAQGPEFQCLTLPFWDWTEDVDDPTNSAVWDTEYGFGTLKSGCVDDGPFAGWKVAKHVRGKACLHRNPGGSSCGGWPEGLPSSAQLRSHVMSSHFQNFWGNTEGYPHGGPHCFVGGNMVQMSSPDDPIFFLHHAFIDKLFFDWQRCHSFDAAPGQMSSHWKKAFPWPDVRIQRMVMHPDMDSCNVEKAWDTKSLGFVYQDAEFEQRTAFMHSCDKIYGRTGSEAKSSLTFVEAAQNLRKTIRAHLRNETQKSGEFDAENVWNKLPKKTQTTVVFLSKLDKTQDVKAAIKEAALHECKFTGTDSTSAEVNSEWAERNNLNKLKAEGFLVNPCKQLEDPSKAAPGSVAAEDIEKCPDPTTLDDGKISENLSTETELYNLKADSDDTSSANNDDGYATKDDSAEEVKE